MDFNYIKLLFGRLLFPKARFRIRADLADSHRTEFLVTNSGMFQHFL